MIVLGRDDFSRAVAREGGWEFVRLETKTFPDGESYFRITEPERLRNEKVVLAVRGRTPGLQQDKLVTESVIVLDRVREAGAGKICLFVPYLPYARLSLYEASEKACYHAFVVIPERAFFLGALIRNFRTQSPYRAKHSKPPH